MRNAKKTGIALGIGMFGIGLVAGFAPQASAQSRAEVRQDRQDVRKAQQNVRQQKRDVKHAGTPANRVEQREQLRDARGNLRDQKQDLRQDLQHRNGANPIYRVPNTHYVPSTRYVPNTRYNGNRYPTNRYGNASKNRTLEGLVTSDFRGNGFGFRASNGQQFTVQVRGGEPKRISRGDRVRVYGSVVGGVFRAQNLAILRNR